MSSIDTTKLIYVVLCAVLLTNTFSLLWTGKQQKVAGELLLGESQKVGPESRLENSWL